MTKCARCARDSRTARFLTPSFSRFSLPSLLITFACRIFNSKQISAPHVTMSRPHTPIGSRPSSRPGTPSGHRHHHSRPGTPSKLQKNPAEDYIKFPPNNLNLLDPRQQSRTEDLIGARNTEPIAEPPSEEEQARVRALADRLNSMNSTVR
ncbi:hypothetical protein T439DRAFT_207396 [Meredithblackwellia eburnea MCA 4105]